MSEPTPPIQSPERPRSGRSRTTPLHLDDFARVRIDWQSFTFRIKLIERVALIAQILLAVHIFGLLPTYLTTRAWQVLANMALSLAGFVLLNVSYRFARRGKLHRAGSLVLLVLIFSPFANVLIIGNNWLFLIGSAATFLVILHAVWPERWRTGQLLTALYLAYFFLVSSQTPIERYDLSITPTAITVDLLNTLAFLGTIVFFGIQAIRTGNLKGRLILAFVVLTLLPVGAAGAVAVYINRLELRNKQLDQMSVVADYRASEIDGWIADLHSNLKVEIERDRAGDQDMTTLLTAARYSPEYWEAYHNLRTRFLGTIALRGAFETLFILKPDGTVVLSSLLSQENQDFSGEPFFQSALTGPALEPLSAVDSAASAANPLDSLIAATPIITHEGRVLGILAAKASRLPLDRLLKAPTGLGPAAEIYLVSPDGNLLTPLADAAAGKTLPLTDGAQKAARDRVNGQSEYRNHRGDPVLAAWRWVPALQAGLLAEIETADVLGLSRLVTTAGIGITILALAVSFVVALLVVRSITQPLSGLTTTARLIAAGDLQENARVDRADEIGELARAFNAMIIQLRALIADLERRVTARTQDLERNHRQLQAAASLLAELFPSALAHTGEDTANPAEQDEPNAEAGIRDPLRDLLNRTARRIPERLGFAHTSIFLADENSQLLGLAAASSRGLPQAAGDSSAGNAPAINPNAQWTVEQLHQLPLQPGAHAQRTVLIEIKERGAQQISGIGRTPDKRRILGALNVQSRDPLAFDAQTDTVLRILADQLAVQIENARLFTGLNQTVSELERAYGKITRAGWQQLLRQSSGPLGYRFRSGSVRPIRQQRPEAALAWKSGTTIETPTSLRGARAETPPAAEATQTNSALAVPVQLRGQTIGVLNLRLASPEAAQEMRPLAEEAAARLALALDNARLLLEAQQRAAQEELVTAATGRLRESLDIDLVLKNAVREVGQTLGLAEVVIELAPPGNGHAPAGKAVKE